MKLGSFRVLLRAHPDKQFRLVLPNKNAVPISFHITEVAHVQKRFIDCGGKLHTSDTCQLQAWVYTDTEHRLLAGKMADVLNLADKVLPENQDLDLEVEYEDMTVSQYPVTNYTITENEVTLYLATKHTDCLAKEICVPNKLPMAAGEETGCGCGPSGCC